MDTSPDFRRKNIRLDTDRYRDRNSYFVTLCFHHRRRLGANARLALWLIANVEKHASLCAFFIHAYCVMPDHIHLLAVGASDESNLIKFVESFKQETGVDFAARTHGRLWQFKYYDRILRASDALDRVAWYIWMNPVRKSLCRTATDYPFLGSFTELGAKLLTSALVTPWSPPWSRAKSEECRAKDRGATFKS
jgi:putative transposase